MSFLFIYQSGKHSAYFCYLYSCESPNCTYFLIGNRYAIVLGVKKAFLLILVFSIGYILLYQDICFFD